jgi:hypothetical protein
MDGNVRPDQRKERPFEAWAPHRYNGRVRTLNSATALALVIALALLASSCGGGGDQGPTSTTTTTAASTTTHSDSVPRQTKQPHREKPGDHQREPAPRRGSNKAAVQSAVSGTKPARLDPSERQVAEVVREYVTALDSRDGERVCALFGPGALDTVRFPRDRGDCAPSVQASVGYRDPRGFPVYEDSRVARIRSVAIDGSEARVVATLVTHFAGNREPSIEDDVVYAQQRGGRWLIAQPSAALYRAIGEGDIPPSVLAPPQ